jgi:hypothetical protein
MCETRQISWKDAATDVFLHFSVAFEFDEYPVILIANAS